MSYKVNSIIQGNSQQVGINNNHFGNGILRGQYFLQTTSDTPGNILSIPVITSPETVIMCNVKIIGIKSDGTSATFGSSEAAAIYTSGSASSIGTLPIVVLTSTTLFVPTASWNVSADTLNFLVFGIAATTINWVCDFEYFTVSSSTG